MLRPFARRRGRLRKGSTAHNGAIEYALSMDREEAVAKAKSVYVTPLARFGACSTLHVGEKYKK